MACHWICVFNFFDQKNFFRPILSVPFSKNVFVFWNSVIIISFKFRILIINFFIKINICIIFHINWLHLNSSMICIIVFIYYIIKFINIHVFDTEVMYLLILVLKVLVNLSATTNFPSLCIEYISISLSYNYFLKELL